MKPWQANPWAVDATSHHEAAHAVTAILLQVPVSYVHVARDGGSGHLKYKDLGETDDRTLEKAVQVSLAGGLAEDRAAARNLRWSHWRPTDASFETRGSREDRKTVDTLCRLLVNDDEDRVALKERELRGRLLNLIEWPGYWQAVESVAAALAEDRVLVQSEVARLVTTARETAAGAPVSLTAHKLARLKRKSAELVAQLEADLADVRAKQPRPTLQLVERR